MGLSLPHLMLLLVILVLVFGTGKLRHLGKDVGGAIRGFREAMQEPPRLDGPTPTDGNREVFTQAERKV